MAKLTSRTLRAAFMPVALLLLLAGLWLWIRRGYLTDERSWRALAPSVCLGWLALVFLIATVASIAWGADDDRRRSFLKWAILISGSVLLLLGTLCGTRLINFWDVLCLSALFVAWDICWLEATGLLRRLAGSALAIALAFTLAMILFAAPVTMVPLVRAAATWRVGMQDTLVSAVGVATPLLGSLDAMKSSLLIDWPQLPRMYQLSILGQDIPRPLPTWWINTLTYAGAAVVFRIAAIMLTRTRAPSLAPGPGPSLPGTR